MGQKVNPHGLRVGVIEKWNSQWYAGKQEFAAYLIEDHKIREHIENKYKSCGISKVVIERPQGKVQVSIHAQFPGKIIGQKHVGIDELKKNLEKLVGDKKIYVNIIEVKHPDLNAKLLAESIAAQLEKRAFFRRTMKQAMSKAMHAGAKGVKVMVGGRLDGAEIARAEHYQEGSIPLQTLRADIDYGYTIARTTFGVLGVKVWIYKGDVLGATPKAAPAADFKEGE
ncbi:30S ribosomal protein S3 [Anaerocaecibacter muris]|uniref:30S ribosomal protein S3 n=1 Tax=Anaerocaecibacter muris TaxID=2941513 RepID=UPI00203EAF64|nr:30S ribosomal protein S3 [Anaerocaecibacter muris]